MNNFLNETWNFWYYSLDKILPVLISFILTVVGSILIFNIQKKLKRTYEKRIKFYFKKYQRKTEKLSFSGQIFDWEEFYQFKKFYEEILKKIINNLSDNSIDKNEYKQIKKEIYHVYEYLSFASKAFKKQIKFNFNNDENSILFSTIVCKFDSPIENDSFIPTPVLNIFYHFNITDFESLYKIDTVNVDLKIKHKFLSFLLIILNINNPFKKIIKKINKTLKLEIEREFNKQKTQLKETVNKLGIPYSFWLPCNVHTRDLWTFAGNYETVKKDDSLLYKYINNYHLDKYNRRMIIFFDVKKINLNEDFKQNVTKAYFNIFPRGTSSIDRLDGKYWINFLDLESIIKTDNLMVLNWLTYIHLNDNYKKTEKI